MITQTGGTLTVDTLKAAAFTWTAGNWNGAGTSTIDVGTLLNLAAGNSKDFDARTIVNNGTINWSAGYLRSGNGGSFTNAAGGTFNDQNASGYTIYNAFGGTFTFSNAGLYLKSTAGTTSVQVPFTNSGAILVQAGTLAFTSTFTNNGGSLFLAGGNTSFAGGLNVGTGTLGGTGTITANVTAGGLVSPGNSPGRLNIAGNLTLLATSTSLFELGGTVQGTSYDFLSVSGTAIFDGTLQLKFVNSFQQSAQPTDTFTLLTASNALNTSFANVANGAQLLTVDGLGKFTVNFGSGSPFAANSLVLSNFVAVPEPSTWALLIAGTLLVACQRRRRSSR